MIKFINYFNNFSSFAICLNHLYGSHFVSIFLVIVKNKVVSVRVKVTLFNETNANISCKVELADINRSIVSLKTDLICPLLIFDAKLLSSISKVFETVELVEKPEDYEIFENTFFTILKSRLFSSIGKQLSDPLKQLEYNGLTLMDFLLTNQSKDVLSVRKIMFQEVLIELLNLLNKSEYVEPNPKLILEGQSNVENFKLDQKMIDQTVSSQAFKKSIISPAKKVKVENELLIIMEDLLINVTNLAPLLVNLKSSIDLLNLKVLNQDFSNSTLRITPNENVPIKTTKEHIKYKNTTINNIDTKTSIYLNTKKKNLIYKYDNSFNPGFVVCDFELLLLFWEMANVNGIRKVMIRRSQIRLIYGLLWLFGLDIKDLILITKNDILEGFDKKKIYYKNRKKSNLLREDENTSFLINLMTHQTKIFFDKYDHLYLGQQSSNSQKLTTSNYFHTVPDDDMESIIELNKIIFEPDAKLTWRSISLSYHIYFSKL